MKRPARPSHKRRRIEKTVAGRQIIVCDR
jgi:hypothetical protein